MSRSLFLVALLVCSASAHATGVTCEQERATSPANPMKAVSQFAIIANPEQYDGKRVQVAGIFRLFYDRIALYPTLEHYEAGEATSVVHADMPSCIDMTVLERMAKWNGVFVRVSGTFDAKQKRFGVGTLTKVESVASLHAADD